MEYIFFKLKHKATKKSCGGGGGGRYGAAWMEGDVNKVNRPYTRFSALSLDSTLLF